jgi:hypothetical protein
MSASPSEETLRGLAFRATSSGAVKRLAAFDKSRHTVPDAANPATNAFLSRLVADELADESERLFQEVRATLGYKRRALSLSVGTPLAVLTATDFVLELAYALSEDDPAEWTLTRTLHPKSGSHFLRRSECDRIFAGAFTDLVFTFARAVDIEAVIDAVEALDEDDDLQVDYPSDCRDCELTVADVDAKVRITANALEMVFPLGGAPSELLDGFLAVRSRFRMAEAGVLGGLLG